jgi:hypothetical protein
MGYADRTRFGELEISSDHPRGGLNPQWPEAPFFLITFQPRLFDLGDSVRRSAEGLTPSCSAQRRHDTDSQTTIEPKKGKREVCVCGPVKRQFVDEDRSRKILKGAHIDLDLLRGTDPPQSILINAPPR